MDPVLAELYGTVEPQEDIEKVAQLDLLQKVAEAHDIDLDELTEEQILEAAAELSDFGQEKTSADELFQNSEYAGKIMAHSMVNELRGIQKAAEYGYSNPLLDAVMFEKEAGPTWDAIKTIGSQIAGGARRAGGAVAGGARRAGGAVAGGARRVGSAARRAGGATKDRAIRASQAVQERAGRAEIRRMAKMEGVDPAAWAASKSPEQLRAMGKKRLKGQAIGAGVGAAALGGTAYGTHRMGKKSFDEAVYERAAEHLAAAGLVDDYGDILPPAYAEKTAQDVDATALGLLQEMGYPVEWY